MTPSRLSLKKRQADFNSLVQYKGFLIIPIALDYGAYYTVGILNKDYLEDGLQINEGWWCETFAQVIKEGQKMVDEYLDNIISGMADGLDFEADDDMSDKEKIGYMRQLVDMMQRQLNSCDK